MIQPVSAVSVSPPAPVAPDDVSVRGGFEVSSAPLPPTSATQAAQFGDFLKATKVDEVALRNRFVQSSTGSKMTGAISSAMKNLSGSEARVRLAMLPRAAGLSASEAVRAGTPENHGHLGLGEPAGTQAQLVAELSPEQASVARISDLADRATQSELMAMEFEINTTLYSKVIEKGDSTINQLVQEK